MQLVQLEEFASANNNDYITWGHYSNLQVELHDNFEGHAASAKDGFVDEAAAHEIYVAADVSALDAEEAAWISLMDYINGRGTPDADLRTNMWASDDAPIVVLAEEDSTVEE